MAVGMKGWLKAHRRSQREGEQRWGPVGERACGALLAWWRDVGGKGAGGCTSFRFSTEAIEMYSAEPLRCTVLCSADSNTLGRKQERSGLPRVQFGKIKIPWATSLCPVLV